MALHFSSGKDAHVLGIHHHAHSGAVARCRVLSESCPILWQHCFPRLFHVGSACFSKAHWESWRAGESKIGQSMPEEFRILPRVSRFEDWSRDFFRYWCISLWALACEQKMLKEHHVCASLNKSYARIWGCCWVSKGWKNAWYLPASVRDFAPTCSASWTRRCLLINAFMGLFHLMMVHYERTYVRT